MAAFTLGLDLGQAQDHTALGIVERHDAELHLRHLERAALGTRYPAIVEHVTGLLGRPTLRGRTELVVDATGLGAPVIDQLRDAGADPVPVVITGGRSVKLEGSVWRVPKRILVAGLVSAFENGRLKAARDLAGLEAFIRELRDFKVKITSRRHATFGSARGHDDLVLAVALAVWWASGTRKPRNGAARGAAGDLKGMPVPGKGQEPKRAAPPVWRVA